MSNHFVRIVAATAVLTMASSAAAQNGFVFEAPVALPTAGSGTAAGDFDGDGHVDLIPFRSPVTILYGNGDGSFTTETHAPLLVLAAAIGPFNADGLADLVIATPELLITYKGTQFDGPVQIASLPISDPRELAVSDLDGDLDLDLVLSRDGGADALLNDGTGHFTVVDSMSSGNGFGNTPLALGDFDGDGDDDVALGGNGPNVRIYLNDGSGAFEMEYLLLYEEYLCWALTCADLDLDGDDDLVLATVKTAGGANRVRVIRSGPGPAWTETGSVTLHVGFPALWHVACGDTNSDGFPDAVVVDLLNHRAYALANVDVGGNAHLAASTMLLTPGMPRHGRLIDVDEDADLDLVVADFNDAPLQLFINVTPPEGGDSSDLTGDGMTTPFDLGLLLVNWGLDGLGDINIDGSIDGRDLGLMLGGWSEDP